MPGRLIEAVIGSESSGNPNAVSPTGAVGYMQLQPAAAAEEGVTDRRDPQQNVVGGSRYLRRMIDRYRGNVMQALAAYQWGPANVDKVGGNFARFPVETQEYIRGIYRTLGAA